MIQWVQRKDADLSREDAERQTYAFMSERPAWKNHPQVVAGAAK